MKTVPIKSPLQYLEVCNINSETCCTHMFNLRNHSIYNSYPVNFMFISYNKKNGYKTQV